MSTKENLSLVEGNRGVSCFFFTTPLNRFPLFVKAVWQSGEFTTTLDRLEVDTGY